MSMEISIPITFRGSWLCGLCRFGGRPYAVWILGRVFYLTRCRWTRRWFR